MIPNHLVQGVSAALNLPTQTTIAMLAHVRIPSTATVRDAVQLIANSLAASEKARAGRAVAEHDRRWNAFQACFTSEKLNPGGRR